MTMQGGSSVNKDQLRDELATAMASREGYDQAFPAHRELADVALGVVAPLLAEARCMDGCDRTPRDPAVRPTAGQMLHQLHDMTPADQVDFMQRMLDASEAAVSCFTHDHEGRLAHRDQLMHEVSWLRREVEFEANGEQWGNSIVGRPGHEYVNGYRACACGVETPTLGDWERHLLKSRVAEGKPLCACVTDEQAAQIVAAGPLWSLPRCAVHPEAGRG